MKPLSKHYKSDLSPDPSGIPAGRSSSSLRNTVAGRHPPSASSQHPSQPRVFTMSKSARTRTLEALRKRTHITQGLCKYCNRPAAAGVLVCTICRVADNTRNKSKNQARKQWYIEHRRCTICSAPLDPDADAGCRTCCNCREHIKWNVSFSTYPRAHSTLLCPEIPI